MSKHPATLASRLICFGSAKACTNAAICAEPAEDTPLLGFAD